MNEAIADRNSASRDSLGVAVYGVAIVYFALHMATSARYGYFRDALYVHAKDYYAAPAYATVLAAGA